VRTDVHEIQPTKDNSLITSLTHMLDCFLEVYRESETKKITNEDLDQLIKHLEAIFFFSVVWSFGCTGDADSRHKFDVYVKSLTKVFPEQKSVYNYYFNTTDKAF